MKTQLLLQKMVFAAGVLAVLGALAGCKDDTLYELAIVHTNDHHGSVLARAGSGGLAERAAFVKTVRAEYKNVLVLDAGDINTGSALSNMFNAEPDIRAYNAIGYDAAALGNHEFDKPLSVLNQQMEWSDFAWLSANIKTADGKYAGKPYIIRDFKGFRVGIFGLTTLRTQVVAAPDKSLVFIPEVEAAREMVKTLRSKEKAGVVILVGHIGDVLESDDHVTSKMIAEQVPGIDLIIDGHSHSKFDEALIVNHTPIVSAGEWGKFAGEAVLAIVGNKVSSWTWRPVEITSAAFPPDAEVAALLAPFAEKADAALAEVVTQTSAEFPFNDAKGNRLPRFGESALGDLMCDATVDALAAAGQRVDFAFHNGGAIRAALPAGAVTKENVLTALAFENVIQVVTLRGTSLLELLSFIGTVKQGAGAFPQISREARWTVTYDAAGNGSLSNVTIAGAPVDPAKTYRIATNDYLAGGGDGYTVLTQSIDTYNSSLVLSDAVIAYLQKQPTPLAPATDSRLTVLVK